MQIEINGKRNITLDFNAPKKFRLVKDGAEIPYIRTGKNSFRLSKPVDDFVELEEIEEQPRYMQPIQLQPQQMTVINPQDVDRLNEAVRQMALVNPQDVMIINQTAEQLEKNQNFIAQTQKEITDNQVYIDQQQQRLNETALGIQALETDNSQRLDGAENAILNLAGEISNAQNMAVDGMNTALNKIEEQGILLQAEIDTKADKDELETLRKDFEEKSDQFSNAMSNYSGGTAYDTLPQNGEAGQILAKRTDRQGDYVWIDQTPVIVKSETIPTASEKYKGEVYQYVGETSDYIHGYIYECQEIDNNFVWVRLDVQPSTAVWGQITGTLSNQTDLQNALNAKANDSDVVKLTGNQSIAGVKSFTTYPIRPFTPNTSSNTYITGYTVKDTVNDLTVNPSYMTEVYPYMVFDKNNFPYSYITVDYKSNGSVETYLYSRTKDTNGNNIMEKIGVYALRDGTTYTSAPTPETSDNSTKIATTAFVKAQGYITSSGSITGSAAKLTTKRTIDGVEFDGSANITHYGTCSTAAATAAKEVSCSGFKLETGANIYVKFSATNTASNPTLNVNGTGAKAIYYNNAAISAGNLKVNRILHFVYNGTQYEFVGEFDTSNNNSLRFGNSIKAQTAITANRLIVGKAAGYNNVSSGMTFDISYPILRASAAITAGSAGSNNYKFLTGVSVRDLIGNSLWTGTQYATVYLVLSALDGVNATVDSTLMTTTVPTSADNKFYIPIGYMYSTYQCLFNPQDKIYAYIDGKFQEYVSASGGSMGDIIDTLYPVGSIYIGTTSTCPLAAIKGTWTLKSSGRVLQGADSNHAAGTTIAAGLPNITGTLATPYIRGSSASTYFSGAFAQGSEQEVAVGAGSGKNWKSTFDASRSSSIYGNSTTVQPPAYVVNIWERTA